MKLYFKIFSLLLALLTLAAACPALALGSFADGAPLIYATDASGVTGDSVTVSIRISGNTGINGFQFHVYYDPEILGLEDAEVTRSGDYYAVNEEENGVEFMWTSLTKYSVKSGVLAQLNFTLLKPGSSAVTVSFDETKGECLYVIENGQTADLDYELQNGLVTVDYNRDEDFCFVAEASDTPLGENATVDLSLINADRAYGFSLELNFDPEKLAFAEGAFTEAFPYGRFVNNESGKVRIFAATPYESPVSGNALAASLIFEVIDPERAVGSAYELTISFYNSQPSYTLDENGKTVKITEVGVFNASFTLTEPPTPEFDPYDLNTDGAVDINDVTVLLNYLSGITADVTAQSADLDGNGDVDIIDVSALLDYLSH